MDYLLLKWIHIISATILFGTGVGSAFLMFLANRRGKIDEIGFATRHVVLADWVFTSPAAIIQLITGIWLAYLADFDLTSGWLFWALVCYFFIGACWLPVVWIQLKMRDLAKVTQKDNAPLPARYWLLDKWWITLGALAFPAMLVVFYLMVFKPTF